MIPGDSRKRVVVVTEVCGRTRTPSCLCYCSPDGLSAGAFRCATLTKGRPVAEESLTKAVLVEEVAEVACLTKKRAEIVVDTVFQGIIDALRRGEKTDLRGLGSFRLRQRAPRKGRNPKNGDRADVPSKRIPYFKAGKELKDLINREPAQGGPPPLSE